MAETDLDLANALDQTLTDLINLGLLAKQGHWNVVGPGFSSLHRLLDELAAVAREAGDRVAERSVILGHNPDGRPGTIAANNRLPSPDFGPLRDTDAVAMFGEILEVVTTGLFASISATECDPVTNSLFVDVADVLERIVWMLRAHTSR